MLFFQYFKNLKHISKYRFSPPKPSAPKPSIQTYPNALLICNNKTNKIDLTKGFGIYFTICLDWWYMLE